jgi:hypothetical protein
MKSFRSFIVENNTTNMSYLYTAGANFAVDAVPDNFDVDQWPEHKSNMKPWEVKNAEGATTRRTQLMRWMKAVTENQKSAVHGGSLPMTPTWQSRKR